MCKNLRLGNRIAVFAFHALFFAGLAWIGLIALSLQLLAAVTRLVYYLVLSQIGAQKRSYLGSSRVLLLGRD